MHSARFAGEPKSDDRNNQKLVADLAGASTHAAHYFAVLVLVRSADDPQPLIAEGRWEGEVIATARGSNGFGYDSHFFLPELGRTAAELDPAHKNRVSHRARALARLAALIAERGA